MERKAEKIEGSLQMIASSISVLELSKIRGSQPRRIIVIDAVRVSKIFASFKGHPSSH
jgi:hypothetical protein